MSERIKYFSTNMEAPQVSFPDALLKGLAPDKGLYMPTSIPSFTDSELSSLKEKSYAQIAHLVVSKFLGSSIDDQSLREITSDAYNFNVPLEKVHDRKYIMRLDQGPTASFKDFAARLMGRLMNHYLSKQNRSMLILTATSGDTGSAIANAFYGLENIKVVVLFPEKEVTERQRKQMTTLGKNIQIVSLNGKFDDCQALVKEAFSDPDLDVLKLSSANSINIGRLIPQSVYYVYAWSRLAKNTHDKIIFTVPSGNFGDLMGGLMAYKMGLPVKKFVIATNANDEVPVYWQTGDYKTIVPSKNCISSAMNVGHPSNMARIVALYGGQMNEKGEILKQPDLALMRQELSAFSVSDEETKHCIKSVWDQYKVLLEPHGAVGWTGLMKNNSTNPADGDAEQLSVCLETAHPAKFPEQINQVLGFDPQLPDSLSRLEDQSEVYDKISSNYTDFKKYLQDKYGNL